MQACAVRGCARLGIHSLLMRWQADVSFGCEALTRAKRLVNDGLLTPRVYLHFLALDWHILIGRAEGNVDVARSTPADSAWWYRNKGIEASIPSQRPGEGFPFSKGVHARSPTRRARGATGRAGCDRFVPRTCTRVGDGASGEPPHPPTSKQDSNLIKAPC